MLSARSNPDNPTRDVDKCLVLTWALIRGELTCVFRPDAGGELTSARAQPVSTRMLRGRNHDER